MPKYLNTLGEQNLAIAICPRCKMKRKYVDLIPDPNTQLMVCKFGCADLFDPYRLPARMADQINLQYPRPDEDLGVFPITDVVIEDGVFWVTDTGEFVVIDESQVVI